MGASRVPMSQPSIEQQQKMIYASQLQQQIEIQKQKQIQEKQQDRLQDVKMLVDNGFLGNNRGGGGAPMRDLYGNVVSTRRNPYNPNAQSAVWFGHAPNVNPQEQQLLNLMQRSQLDQQPTLTQSQYTQEMPVQAQQQYQPTLAQSIYLPPQEPSLQEMEKRQRQLLLQRELLQQIDDKDRKKMEGKLMEKREKELDDLRVVREREELERRMREEYGMDKLGQRNLQQTYFDVDKEKAQRRIEMLKYQNSLLEQQNLKNAHSTRIKRQRTPVDQAEQSYRGQLDEQMKERIEQRIIRELPVEVEKTVRETVNVELQRLRQEMNLSSNQVSEQLVQLKGQLLKSNEARHYNEEQVRRLKDELRQTQIVDEIRQRELYQAFLGQEKNRQILDSTQRLMTPETVKFTFPRRPRPYYNMSDPYLGTNDDANKDLHKILNDQSESIPITHDFGKEYKFDMDSIGDKMLFNRNEIKEDSRKGHSLSNNIDLPDDYINRQQLYIPKYNQSDNNDYTYQQWDRQPVSMASGYGQGEQQQYNQRSSIIEDIDNDVKDVILRNDSKLDKLDQLDGYRSDGKFEQMDYALQDLLQQQTNKTNRIDYQKDQQYQYNDFYSPDYLETNFYDKMGKILSQQY